MIQMKNDSAVNRGESNKQLGDEGSEGVLLLVTDIKRDDLPHL